MFRALKYYKLMFFRHDLFAGLSVFLIALPLCLGISLASGAPLYSGLLSGIIGGIIVALISGSHLAVSGPAAGLTTLVASSIISLGDYRIFLLTIIIAGLFQIFLSILKLGTIANYFPSSVIKGMLAAIGIILIIKQIPYALGFDSSISFEKEFMNLLNQRKITENINEIYKHFSLNSIIITSASFILIIFLPKLFSKTKLKIPTPLIVVLLGILLYYCFKYFLPNLTLKQSQLVNIPDNLFSNIMYPSFSKIFSNMQIWKDGIVIGLLCSLETLLCIEAIDKLDHHKRTTPLNRELFAQGIGNILCGILGAIPITAVVVRGAANVQAGGKTKLSAITHGFFLLFSIIFLPFILNKIPYSSLATILILTGYNLCKPKIFKSMWNLKTKQFLPFLITIILILLTDLLTGVFIGLLISIYFIIQNNFKAEYKLTKAIHNGIETNLILLNSNVTFLNKVRLKKILNGISDYSVLTIDGSKCNFIDYDILELISEFCIKAKDKHIELHLIDIQKVNISTLH